MSVYTTNSPKEWEGVPLMSVYTTNSPKEWEGVPLMSVYTTNSPKEWEGVPLMSVYTTNSPKEWEGVLLLHDHKGSLSTKKTPFSVQRTLKAFLLVFLASSGGALYR
ncbi:hypothetical protein [Cohnella faecalis]